MTTRERDRVDDEPHDVSPSSHPADYFYGDREIAEIDFVHGGPSDPGVVPQFSIDRFDLL